MASGWASDDAVNKQIETTIADAVDHVRSRINKARASAAYCLECGDPIPEARRKALPGVIYCITCQLDYDKAEHKTNSLYNRRGSKNSQLR